MTTKLLVTLVLATAALCDSACDLGRFASGTNGAAALKYAHDQEALYLANDLGPIAAIAQAAQQATVCLNEETKGSAAPSKTYLQESEPLPLYYSSIAKGRADDIPNSAYANFVTLGHVGGRRIILLNQGMATICMKQFMYPNGQHACSHRTLLLCNHLLSSVIPTGSNITAANMFAAGAECFPLYQEVEHQSGSAWVNVMPYDIPQQVIPTKAKANVLVLPKEFVSNQLTGLTLDSFSVGDPQAASGIPTCPSRLFMRHQLEANLGFPIVRRELWNSTKYSPPPPAEQVILQTLAAGCAHTGVPPERKKQCDELKAAASPALSVKQTGKVCVDRDSGVDKKFMYTTSTLYIANTGGVLTTGVLPTQVAELEAQGVLLYPPTSTVELLLACITCALALVSSKKADVTKVSDNLVKFMKRAILMNKMFFPVAIYLLIAAVASSSALSILVTNVL